MKSTVTPIIVLLLLLLLLLSTRVFIIYLFIITLSDIFLSKLGSLK